MGVHVVILALPLLRPQVLAVARELEPEGEVVPARCARLPMVAIPMVKSAVTATFDPSTPSCKRPTISRSSSLPGSLSNLT